MRYPWKHFYAYVSVLDFHVYISLNSNITRCVWSFIHSKLTALNEENVLRSMFLPEDLAEWTKKMPDCILHR